MKWVFKLLPGFLPALWLCLDVSRGSAQWASSSAVERYLSRTLAKISAGQPLTKEEIVELEGSLVRVDDTRLAPSRSELKTPGEEKKVYLLRVAKSGDGFSKLLEMQKSLLQSQLTVMKALEIIVLHQAQLERRVARSENVSRELIWGMKDIGQGLDRARLDVAGQSAGIEDLGELSSIIHANIIEIIKGLE